MDIVLIFKALGDHSRLSMIREIIEDEVTVEVLCEKLKLVSSTVSHHAAKLVNAGLIEMRKEGKTVIYSINKELLETPLIQIVSEGSEPGNKDRRSLVYSKKVLENFLEFGKLKSIPTRRKKRRIILEQIVSNFDYNRKYREMEVNEILKEWHEDYCFLRREMICENLMERKDGMYWRVDD
ncbi:metalloregulator ArsR/SmtB family transcription factor [bacterium]|jgi:ArsR family transcriptional regulator, arsenate/arsenite/antimonite-responsive transcriptional repressor|nr:metalloregulator ArsR/SmtB family transcription factor [bacterium]